MTGLTWVIHNQHPRVGYSAHWCPQPYQGGRGISYQSSVMDNYGDLVPVPLVFMDLKTEDFYWVSQWP